MSSIAVVRVPQGENRSFDRAVTGQLIEKILGRENDLISYGRLKPKMDDDIRRDAVLL